MEPSKSTNEQSEAPSCSKDTGKDAEKKIVKRPIVAEMSDEPQLHIDEPQIVPKQKKKKLCSLTDSKL